jgi:hypothetical protein
MFHAAHYLDAIYFGIGDDGSMGISVFPARTSSHFVGINSVFDGVSRAMLTVQWE